MKIFVYQPLVKIRIRQPGHLDPVSVGYGIAVCAAHSRFAAGAKINHFAINDTQSDQLG